MDVVVLCGGLGTRLQDIIDDRPKPMAEINGKPFLDILIEYVARYGFVRFILCTGYKGDFIRRHYENKKGRLIFFISEEDQPLGTAGAIKNAETFIESDTFLVLNGDSLCEIDLIDFIKFHVGKKASISIALTTMKNPADYGVIKLDKDQRIIRFSEKLPAEETTLVNIGMYLFVREILEEIPPREKSSLEHDLFPRILDRGVYGYLTQKKLVDIGTPERFERMRNYFRKIEI